MNEEWGNGDKKITQPDGTFIKTNTSGVVIEENKIPSKILPKILPGIKMTTNIYGSKSGTTELLL